jgi:hypothetical protein
MAFDEGAGSRNIVDDNIGVVGGLLLQAVADRERVPAASEASANGFAARSARGRDKAPQLLPAWSVERRPTPGIIRWKEGFPRADVVCAFRLVIR